MTISAAQEPCPQRDRTHNANDIKMLKNAGLGVAMGESAPYVKECANEVTTSNDNDGVAVILEKLFLDKNVNL